MEGGREGGRERKGKDLPMPVATARAKETSGSFCSSFNSSIKFLMSALGRGSEGRIEGGREGEKRERPTHASSHGPGERSQGLVLVLL
jgi:hypothetical protein